jgi:hypothetical protein
MNYRLGNRLSKSIVCSLVILYLAFLALDFFGGPVIVSSTIKFTTIVLCLMLTVARTLCYQASVDRVLLNVAFVFTVIADVFLLFRTDFQYGVIAFCIVQLIYFYRMFSLLRHTLRMENRVHRRRQEKGFLNFLLHIAIRIVVSALIILVLQFNGFVLDILLLVSVFYFVNFVGNLIFLILLSSKRHYMNGQIRYGLFFLGMVLFFLCDIQVGIYNLPSYLSNESKILDILVQISGIGMWACYLPGQVAICLSDAKYNRNTRGSFI